jgi:hypothetical protein
VDMELYHRALELFKARWEDMLAKTGITSHYITLTHHSDSSILYHHIDHMTCFRSRLWRTRMA